MLRPFLLAFFLAGMLCGCNGDSDSSETVTSGVNESASVEPETRPTKTVANKISDEENELDADNGIQPRIGGGINTGKAPDTESIATTNSASQDTNTLEENITSVQSIETNVSIDSSLNSGTESNSQTESASSSTSEQTTTESGTESNSQTETTSSSTSEQTTTESGTESSSQTKTTASSTSEQTTTDSGTESNSQTESTSSSTPKQTTTDSGTTSNSQTELASSSTSEQTTTESGTESNYQAKTTSSSTSEQTTTDSGTESNSQTESTSSSTPEQTTTDSGTTSNSQTELASSSTSEQTTTESGTESNYQAKTTSSSTSEQTTTDSGTASNSQTETTSNSTSEQTTTDSGTESNSQTETTSSSTSEQTTTDSGTESNSQTESTSSSTPEQTTTDSGTESNTQTETTSSSTSEQTTTESGTESNSQTESASSSTSEQTTTESGTESNSQTESASSSEPKQTTTDSGTTSDSQAELTSSSAPEQTTNDGVESSSQTSTATSSTSGQVTTNDETVSGSKTGATTNTSPTYRFIDSPVEGLFYTTSSGHSGVTGAQGQFEANEDDVVTFYLGDKNGIKLGTASVQTVLTPFEITGKYTRAVALARLFLSLDNQYGLPKDNTLTIPSYLSQSLSKQNLAVLSYLRLNNMDSVRTVLIGLGISSFNIVSESQAIHHLEASLKQVSRGDAGKSNPFANREIMHIKHVVLPQNKVDANLIVQPIHIDKILDDQYFGFTDGMPFEDFTLEGEVITKLATSNSKLIQIPYEYKPAGFYHTLLSAVKDTNFNSSHYRATAESNLFTVSGQTDLYDVSIKVQPLVVDQWWERQVTSLFYDPATQVFTKTEKIAQLSGFNIDCGMYDCFETWSSEAVSYYYPVSVPSGERYIDFVGTWLETRVCFDGTIAKRTLVFDDTKLTATGSMCLNRTSVPVMGTLELSYEDLQHTEFWWFNQIGRQSKATLSELNSTIRLTTPELYPRSYSCVNPHEITVKWEYHPAGENWDRGLVNKTRINCDGTINLYSTMQKQF